MQQTSLNPFIKWAGGKRQLLPQIKQQLPSTYKNYYEPFVGGGAVLFELRPNRATINDINEELIHTYKVIRDNPLELMQKLCEYDQAILNGKKEYYYQSRELFNNNLKHNILNIEQAALFIFLNKHCFNGLYRVNAKGLFNVPYNDSTRSSFDTDELLAVSQYLKGINIISGDFEMACANVQKGDFVFFDSPYAPLNPTSFESYTKEGFSENEHRRLSILFDHLTEIGCFCMLTNHNTPFIHSLYDNKGYSFKVVDVKRMINSDASNRTGQEIIICNYDAT